MKTILITGASSAGTAVAADAPPDGPNVVAVHSPYGMEVKP